MAIQKSVKFTAGVLFVILPMNGCVSGRAMSLDSNTGDSDTGDLDTGDSDTGDSDTSDSSCGTCGIDMQNIPDGPLCIGEDCTDGLADSRLSVYTPSGSSPSLGLAAGDVVRVFGHEFGCSDAGPWFVVRDMADGQLVAATFKSWYPSEEWFAEFGETRQTATAPLMILVDDFGLCSPYDAGCDNATYDQRGAFELNDGETVARVLDHGVGWAPRGYHVDVPYWEIGTSDCGGDGTTGQVYIHRSDCGEACPAPDFATSCEPETIEASDAFSFHVFDYDDECIGDDFDAQCVVLPAEPADPNQPSIPLDCVFSDPLE